MNYFFNIEPALSGTILFTGDRHYILKAAETLFSDSGLRLLKAENAKDALKIIRSEKIAVIVSDNDLPDTRGIDLLEYIREISPKTMGILITTDADLRTAIDAINNGIVSRVIMKPWTGDHLFKNVIEVIKQHQLACSLHTENKAALLSMVQAVELKDLYTLGHCDRVAVYSLMLANAAKMSTEEKKDIKYGSALHDLGKIHIPAHILNKNGPLDHKEQTLIREHPVRGANVARHIGLSERIVNIICYHHERFDGTGYPEKLRAEEIPLEARIVTMADIYDAITSNRPYRDKSSKEEAVKMLTSMGGSVLDPELLELFINKCLISETDPLSIALSEASSYSDEKYQSIMNEIVQVARLTQASN
ncbi:MAG: HD domain-containing protein [Nitrospira sp.]|nr:HD domain-containing protein [bacterium]MBL7048526.1 HD domain-containing protein [Nitrospira sp.]